MTCCAVTLSTLNDIKHFVALMNKAPYKVDLGSGKYIVDAKSILGVFTLNPAKPLELKIHSDECSELLEDIKSYIVK